MKLSVATALIAVILAAAVSAAPQGLADEQAPQVAEEGLTASEPKPVQDEAEEVDETEESGDLAGGHHDGWGKKKEQLIHWKSVEDAKGYEFEYKTDQGTHVFQTGRLVKDQCWCTGDKCGGGPSCGGCHCDHKGCSGGDHCRPDECPGTSPISRGGFRCGDDGRLLRSESDEPIPAPVSEVSAPAPVADEENQGDVEPAEEPEDLAGGHSGECKGKHCNKVIIVTKGGFKFDTPDCFRVSVTYKAGFQGFEPKVELKRIPHCKPKHEKPECRGGKCPPGAEQSF